MRESETKSKNTAVALMQSFFLLLQDASRSLSYHHRISTTRFLSWTERLLRKLQLITIGRGARRLDIAAVDHFFVLLLEQTVVCGTKMNCTTSITMSCHDYMTSHDSHENAKTSKTAHSDKQTKRPTNGQNNGRCWSLASLQPRTHSFPTPKTKTKKA